MLVRPFNRRSVMIETSVSKTRARIVVLLITRAGEGGLKLEGGDGCV